ncbi:hypothetical protein M432DRAFT_607761 [Thermoascus aurantiacus ATCC 26904]
MMGGFCGSSLCRFVFSFYDRGLMHLTPQRYTSSKMSRRIRDKYRGIHPIEALQSHRENLGKLIDKALRPSFCVPLRGESQPLKSLV